MGVSISNWIITDQSIKEFGWKGVKNVYAEICEVVDRGCLCQVSRAGIAETRRPSSSRGTTIDQPLSAVARRDESHRRFHDPRQRGHETILPPSFTKMH